MAGEWTETVLEEITTNSDRAFAMGPFGSNIKAENYRESGVPVIRGTNLGEIGDTPFKADAFVFLDEKKADDLAKSNCAPNDIVFVAQGTVGKVGIVPANTPYRRFVLSQNLMKVTVDPERADPRFVFYFYRSSLGQHEIMSRVNPTGVPCISKPLTSLRQFGIRLPADVREQRAIAHILGTLDDKIELNRRMNETLEAMARALFKSWFVDFDPVRAKAEGRDTGLPEPLADLFPSRFVTSQLGEIPEGWTVGRLDSVLVLQRGFDLPSPQRTAGAYPMLAASGPSGTHDEFMVRGPGVTTGRSGLLGKVFYVHDDFWPLNTSLWVKEFRHSMPAYAFHLLRGLDFELFNAGSAVPTLNRNHVHNLPALRPPMALIASFERIATASLKRQKNNGYQSLTLAVLRDALLPKLISSEQRVMGLEM